MARDGFSEDAAHGSQAGTPSELGRCASESWSAASEATLAGQAMLATKETALLAAHRSAGAAVLAAGAAAASAEYLVSAMAAGLYKNKERCKALLLKTTYETRRQVLGNFKDLIKTSLTEDPHMWKFLKVSVGRCIDRLWNEVEEEIERDLETVVLEQFANDDVKGPLGSLFTKWYWRCRAFLLNRYLPHNKSIFGKLRDPVYIVILLMAMSPICGLRFIIFSVVLVMLCNPGPPDEYMLFNFIMLFKGYQFISTACFKSLWQTLVYIYCYSIPEDLEVRACARGHGPATSLYAALVADYLGNIVLTFSAWRSLGFATKYAENRFICDGGQLPDSSQPKTIRVRSPHNSLWTPSRTRTDPAKVNGREMFQLLMKYDVACFIFSFVLFLIVSWLTCWRSGPLDHIQLKVNLFWCNVACSVLALPFQPLNIPWLFGVFTRSMPTGFNEKGACVPFKIAVLEVPKKRSQGAWKTLVDIRDFGQQRRRGDLCAQGPPDASYLTLACDFSYGLWRAVLYSEMDSKDASQVPEDLFKPQGPGGEASVDHLLTVWDKF